MPMLDMRAFVAAVAVAVIGYIIAARLIGRSAGVSPRVLLGVGTLAWVVFWIWLFSGAPGLCLAEWAAVGDC